MSMQPPIYRLPEELLLQIASQLPDSATPKHLKHLSLVSSKFRPAAQEALHAVAKLFVSCGCHPQVNPIVFLLRTILDRPELATKIKALRFRTVRKNVDKLYKEQNFDLNSLRAQCWSRLTKLGYTNSHPWWRSLNNSIESTFAGILLTLLPNLVSLDIWVKDHHRGPPSSECITGLFGTVNAPEVVRQGWKNLQHLTTGDSYMLKLDIDFNLTSLDLKTISIGTVLRLNGFGSLQGTENLHTLALTVSIQFADRPLVDKAEVQLGNLFDALGCKTLSSLKIQLVNDGYNIGDDLMTQLDVTYFMDQLRSVQSNLETLAISFESTEDESELEWLLDMCTQPKGSLEDFTVLKQLVLPQPFLYTTVSRPGSCQPKDLPSKLETLEILYPHEDVEEWVSGFVQEDSSKNAIKPPYFKELTLTCRDEVGTPASYFAGGVDRIWWILARDLGIETYAFCQIEGYRKNLAEIYDDQIAEGYEDDWSDDDSDDNDNDDKDSDDNDSDEIDSDDDDCDDDNLPDLIDPMD